MASITIRNPSQQNTNPSLARKKDPNAILVDVKDAPWNSATKFMVTLFTLGMRRPNLDQIYNIGARNFLELSYIIKAYGRCLCDHHKTINTQILFSFFKIEKKKKIVLPFLLCGENGSKANVYR